jgi:hypothetical protein
VLRRYFPPAGPAAPDPAPAGPPATPVGPPPAAANVPLAEPAATFEPEEGPAAGADVPVGIDLGTTYSLIAYVDGQGRP